MDEDAETQEACLRFLAGKRMKHKRPNRKRKNKRKKRRRKFVSERNTNDILQIRTHYSSSNSNSNSETQQPRGK